MRTKLIKKVNKVIPQTNGKKIKNGTHYVSTTRPAKENKTNSTI